MKALTKLLLVAVLVMGLPNVAMAATDDSALTVTVSSIDLLTVGDATGITLTLTGAAGTDALSGADDATATLNYTHNSATNKKITAEVTTDPTGDDITLTVTVLNGAGEQTICTNGTAAAAQIVYDTIAAGALTEKTVTYHATATTATPPTDYVFVITYTSTDV